MIRLSFMIVFFITSNISAHILDTVPLIDGHNDLPSNLYELLKNNITNFEFNNDLSNDPVWGTSNCAACYTDLIRLRKGKVGSQFWAAYVGCDTQFKDAVARTLEQIDVIKRLVKKYPDDMQFITTADGILDAFKNKKIGSLIGVEGGHSMDSRLAILRTFHELGVRYMTLTHTCNTPWADNSFIDDSEPVLNLTNFGEMVVYEMNRLGIMVDLSHVSHNVMNRAITISKAPVIFSHSSAYTIYHHNRNVHDDTLEMLKENNGIIMVNFYNNYVSAENATIDDVIKHINHIALVAGVDHIGIGADYDGISQTPKGLEDVSKYPDLFDKLKLSQPDLWTDENLQKLAGLNLIRVFKDVEKVRDSLSNEEPNQYWITNEDLISANNNISQCRSMFN